jgi:hypothetical protein
MKFLLTSAGITNTTIHTALVEMLGKPIAASSGPVRAGGGRCDWRKAHC